MELPDIRQLIAFHLLAETRSFTAAAKRLYVTQSAVSHAIKALERTVDCRLFDRSGKQIALTAEGEAFLQKTRSVVRNLQLAMEEVTLMRRWGHGKLRIGAADTICQYFLPHVLREFRECFPQCDLSIVQGDAKSLIGGLENGNIDFAITLFTDGADSKLDSRPLFTDQLSIIISPLHPLTASSDLLAEDLSDHRLIIYNRASFTFHLIELWFRRGSKRLPPILELGNMEAIKEMAKIGIGIGIVAPWVAEKEVTEGSLMLRPLEGESNVERNWGLFGRKNRKLNLMEETFAGICQTVARDFSLPPQSAIV